MVILAYLNKDKDQADRKATWGVWRQFFVYLTFYLWQ